MATWEVRTGRDDTHRNRFQGVMSTPIHGRFHNLFFFEGDEVVDGLKLRIHCDVEAAHCGLGVLGGWG